MIDIQIIRYLYSKKNDGLYYDVSVIFNVTNPNNYFNTIDYSIYSTKAKESQNQLSLIGKLIKRTRDKSEIDRVVVALEENGYVFKKIEGYLPSSAISEDDDPEDANNSVCKISNKGIEYYENYTHNNKTRNLTIVSLILSLVAIVISFLALYSLK